jgi:membrane-associated phospholipid phosphatase
MSASGQSHLPELETAAKPITLMETAALLSLAVAVLSLFLFAWIAEGVSHQQTMKFDLGVRSRVHTYASPNVTRAMMALSFLGGDGLILALIVAVLAFLFFGWRRATLWLVITLLGALVLDLSLKYSFHRLRPAPFFGALPRTYSFPSGHALFSFCFYGVLAGLWAGRTRSVLGRTLIWTMIGILVSGIGLSRIYLGVHYPSDVIAGYLAAMVWVSTLVTLDRLRVRKGKNSEIVVSLTAS